MEKIYYNGVHTCTLYEGEFMSKIVWEDGGDWGNTRWILGGEAIYPAQAASLGVVGEKVVESTPYGDVEYVRVKITRETINTHSANCGCDKCVWQKGPQKHQR